VQRIQPSPRHATPKVVPVAITTRVSTLNQVGGRFDYYGSRAISCFDPIRKRVHEGWIEFFCRTNPANFGGSINRRGLQAFKLQIEAGEMKVVLIFKFERMLRNTDEWAPFRSFLARHGCRLVSTTEDLSEETPSGRLKNSMLVSVADYERLNTAEKVRAKLAELAKRGIWNCGRVLFSYLDANEPPPSHPRSCLESKTTDIGVTRPRSIRFTVDRSVWTVKRRANGVRH